MKLLGLLVRLRMYVLCFGNSFVSLFESGMFFSVRLLDDFTY